MAITAKSMPSMSSGTPKVKRAAPELTSVPIKLSNKPNITIARALMNEPWASTTAAMRPMTMSEKYSAGPNLKAISANGGAKAAIKKVATVPAKNEPRAAMARASPALPLRAI